MIVETVSQRRDLLATVERIAIVGASANTARASYFVFSYLRTHGRFTVTPVNPKLEQIDGVRAFADLHEYALAFGPPDLVDVFRRPTEVFHVTREAIAIGAKAIWFQYGIINAEAIALADAAGLAVVVDRCLKVETARFNGGLAMGGIDTGLITSRRRIS